MITIGADPEVFLNNKGTVVSAIGHVGGDKKDPIKVHRGAVQEDNVLAEFNIDPASTMGEFTDNIKVVMSQLRERVSPLGITIKSSHVFTKQELMRSGRKALMFGCDPDYNAYTGKQNIAPSALTGLRTAGGHVHVGYANATIESNRKLVKNMDLLLGVPSVLLDSDTDRRSMYGKAGAYRNKPYGVEYRSLSNFWLSHTDLIRWVYEQTQLAVALDYDYDSDAVEQAINCSDEVLARRLIEEYGVLLP